MFPLFIKFRVKGVEVSGIEIILGYAEGFAKPLKMHDFPLSEELDGIPYIGVIGKAQDIVISCACLLLCCRP